MKVLRQIIEQVESGWCNWDSIVYALREGERRMREGVETFALELRDTFDLGVKICVQPMSAFV